MQGVVKFHPKCFRVHLSFADDLLIFAKGTVDSVNGIWCILQEFHYFSSLQLNVSKTDIFVAGMAKDDLVLSWEGCL